MIGEQFGRLVVVGEAPRKKYLRFWICKCSCGNTVNVYQGDLLRKHRNGRVPTRSCGCMRKEMLLAYHTTHGQCGTRTYKKWQQMRARVRASHLKKNSCYAHVAICKRWDRFGNFLTDMGECPPGHTLDRIKNSRGYYKNNCRWATKQEQSTNRRNVRMIYFNGKTQSIAAWSRELGIYYQTLVARLNRTGSMF